MIQLAMIERVKALSRETLAISAVLMYGSFVKGEGDKYSDIEFYIFVDSDIDFNKREWVDSIEKTALFFSNEYGTDVAIFENLVRGEFHFMKVDQIDIINSWVGLISFEYWENMILVDKGNRLSQVFEGITKDRPIRNEVENLRWLQYSLINLLLFTKNLLLRREWAHAHQNFFQIHKYLLWLIRINVESTIHWESPTKKLEADLPTVWYTKYTQCTASLNDESLHIAFTCSIVLAEELFRYQPVDTRCIDLLIKISCKV